MIDSEKVYVCPICRREKFRFVFTCEDHFVSGEAFDIIECESCGLRITKDFPCGDEIDVYYQAEDYVSHSDTKKGAVNSLYHTVREYMLKEKAQWVEKYAPSNAKKLMDVGCGTGYFPALMQKRGWEVVGIEKNTLARDFAEKHFNVQLFPSTSSFEQAHEQKGFFDAITLWHVLEHLEDLNESMKQFYEHLNADGALFIAVPNRSSTDAQKYKQFWAAYDVPRHLWHFAPKQMKLLAQNHGFEIIDIKPFHFDGFYISMMSEKYKNKANSIVKGFFSGLSTFLSSVNNKRNSSSLLYVMKKKR